MSKQGVKMKRGKKMLLIILSICGVLGLITWGVIAYLGQSQVLSVKSIEPIDGNLYFIHLVKPEAMTWQAGAYAKISLANDKEDEEKTVDITSGATKCSDENQQKSRWLTIASNPEEDEILILTHNSGSLYKKNLTSLPVGSKVKMSWLGSHLSVGEGEVPLVYFASDVGIATIRPIIKQWAGKREIILNHLDKGVHVFDEEIGYLASQVTNLTYETSESLSQSQEQLKKEIDQYGNQAKYFLAGQPDDIKAMEQFLKDNGIKPENIKNNQFRGLR